jgi:hypothetical protein
MGLAAWFRTRQQEPERSDDRLRRLESDMKQLQLEWEETYGKVRRALATLARRQQRESEGEAPSDNGAPSPATAALSPEEYGRVYRDAVARARRL